MNACERNSTALLSMLPESCPGDLIRAPDRHAQSPASASKASGCNSATQGLQARSSLQDGGSVCAQQHMQCVSDASAKSVSESRPSAAGMLCRS